MSCMVENKRKMGGTGKQRSSLSGKMSHKVAAGKGKPYLGMFVRKLMDVTSNSTQMKNSKMTCLEVWTNVEKKNIRMIGPKFRIGIKITNTKMIGIKKRKGIEMKGTKRKGLDMKIDIGM